MAAWVARAEDANAFREMCPGKRMALLDLTVERAWQKKRRNFRLIVRVTERTIDRYAKHGTHEQFHSDKFAGSEFGRRQAPIEAALRTSADHFKTDLDLERLPSGKFDCNDLILHLGMFAYNCRIGQLGLTGELAPVRHPAKRRRLKTVLQELMYRAAQFIRKARQRILDFGRSGPVVAVSRAVHEDLLTARHE